MNREVSENTFREYHDQLVDTAFPWCLWSMRSETHAKLQEHHEHTYSSFSRDADLPLQKIHGAIGSFGRFSIEALDNA